MIGKAYRFVYYDCDVCDKKHQLRVQWSKEIEGILEKFHSIDAEQEIQDTLMETIKQEFKRLHPDDIFDKLRVQFERKE